MFRTRRYVRRVSPACDDGIRLCDNGCNDWNDACHTACGTIPVRAMVVDGDDTSCTAVFDSSVGVDGTVHQFTTSSKTQPDPQTQSGIEYSNFGGLRPGSYTVNSQAPSDYVPVRSCWYKYGVSGEGLIATLGDNEVLVWELGYTQGTAWSQVQEGDVYASARLRSFVPPLDFFIVNGAGGYPGVATCGGTAPCSLASNILPVRHHISSI